jgi:hypothetical protein
VGWLLLVSGIIEIVHAFGVRRWSGFFLHLIGGVLGVLIGLLVVTHPLAGAVAWTLLFASFSYCSYCHRPLSSSHGDQAQVSPPGLGGLRRHYHARHGDFVVGRLAVVWSVLPGFVSWNFTAIWRTLLMLSSLG